MFYLYIYKTFIYFIQELTTNKSHGYCVALNIKFYLLLLHIIYIIYRTYLNIKKRQ
jgi:hypothetical protein